MKPLKVDDKYRTSPHSLVPGGCVVEIHTKDGKVMIYDKVKNPEAYIRRISKDYNIDKVLVEGKEFKL